MKIAIAHTFANRTDTFETWEVLQQDCLLIRQEQQAAAPSPHRHTGLLRRLQQTREPPEVAPARSTQVPPRPGPRRPTSPDVAASPDTPCGLTVLSNQRMIQLPKQGEFVLGRFDYGVGQPPDADLTFDDGLIPSVSRRHALIIARRGKHWIEDMGSTNGTYLDGNRLTLGKSAELAPDTRIMLGRCRLVYAPLPAWVVNPDPNQPHVCALRITHTGDEIPLPDKATLMIGRSDSALAYEPDIDLRDVGEIGRYVSRRHARIIARQGRHFVEEVGSTSGTRLNGQPLRVGAPPRLLNPGDQLSLGGCVIAYEWRLLEGEA